MKSPRIAYAYIGFNEKCLPVEAVAQLNFLLSRLRSHFIAWFVNHLHRITVASRVWSPSSHTVPSFTRSYNW